MKSSTLHRSILLFLLLTLVKIPVCGLRNGEPRTHAHAVLGVVSAAAPNIHSSTAVAQQHLPANSSSNSTGTPRVRWTTQAALQPGSNSVSASSNAPGQGRTSNAATVRRMAGQAISSSRAHISLLWGALRSLTRISSHSKQQQQQRSVAEAADVSVDAAGPSSCCSRAHGPVVPGSTSSHGVDVNFKWGSYVILNSYTHAVILWLRVGHVLQPGSRRSGSGSGSGSGSSGADSSSSSSAGSSAGSSSSSEGRSTGSSEADSSISNSNSEGRSSSTVRGSIGQEQGDNTVDCDCGGGGDLAGSDPAAESTAVVAAASGFDPSPALPTQVGVGAACDCSRHKHPRTVRSSSSSSGNTASSSSSSRNSTSSSSSVRRLLQQGSALCPPGCKPGACREVGTAGGLWCTECINNLLSSKVAGVCTCPAGRYMGPGTTCVDCPKGSYCPGGTYDPASSSPRAVPCPDNMSTVGLRASSKRACVNMPGHFYIFAADGDVAASRCPADTFSAGWRKQRACVPCPTGFVTHGQDGQTSPSACSVPLGYFLKGPGVAAPCPKGTYTNSTRSLAQCVACPLGTTTVKEGAPSSDACTVLEAGSYARVLQGGAIRDARPCPQKYWCPGGVPVAGFDPANLSSLDPSETTLLPCPDGMWTQGTGATAVQQCLTPPGHFTANGATQPCPPGSYRADWVAAGVGQACTPCGDNVQLDMSSSISVFDAVVVSQNATRLLVAATQEDCYILPGQGLFFSSGSGTFRARNCDGGGEFGVANTTYGLSPSPCRTCPLNQVTSSDATQYPTSASFYVMTASGYGGFTSSRACVNQPGFGLNARVSSKCDLGFYNEGDTSGPCKACPVGLTTAGEGASERSQCGVAAGFGFAAGSIKPCPIGTYNDQPYQASQSAACTACASGTTSAVTGGNSSTVCDRCLPGQGGASCQQQCGGASATYQPPGMPVGSSCLQCQEQTPGYNFYWNNNNEVYGPTALAKAGASGPTDCVAEFAQLADGAWWLPLTANAGVELSSQASFADCVQQCRSQSDCQLVTYDYSNSQCAVRRLIPPTTVGPPVLGFKAVPSNSLLGASGYYTFWQDPNAMMVGTNRASPASAPTFTSIQDCMSACDDEAWCAGFTILMRAVQADRPPTCSLILGDPTPGTSKRTVIRTDLTRLTPPRI